MTPHRSLFQFLIPDHTPVKTANGKVLHAAGRGSILLVTTIPNLSELVLYNVLFVPDLEFNLVSVVQLLQDHMRVEFCPDLTVRITDSFRADYLVEASYSWTCQAFLLPVPGGTAFTMVTALISILSDDDDELEDVSSLEGSAIPQTSTHNDRSTRLRRLWHERLGHIGWSALPTLAKNSIGLPDLLSVLRVVCDCAVCSLTNIRRSPFPDSVTKTTRALELVHGDLTGRIVVKSLGGAEYLAILVDDFTRMTWGIPLARKSDFVSKFIEWRDEVVPFKGSIACLRTDGGGEFDNHSIKAALLGARHEMSCAYTSQQNGVAERFIGSIKRIMRPLLHGRQVPLEYWAEAAQTAIYIRNRSPTSALGGKTPYEAWHGTPPDVSGMRVFGCLAFAMLPDKDRAHSLAPRGKEGVFVGYDKQRKGYRIHFPADNKTMITRHVEFHEDKAFDFQALRDRQQEASQTAQGEVEVVLPSSSGPQPPTRPRIVVIGPRRPPPPLAPVSGSVGAPAPAPPLAPVSGSVGASAPAPPSAPAAAPPSAPAPVEPAAPAAPTAPAAPAPAPAAPAAPAAVAPGPPQRPPPTTTRSYMLREHVMRQRLGREHREQARAVLSMRNSFAFAFRVQLSADGVVLEPSTLDEAMRRPDWPLWLGAMREEMESHEEMGTWVIEELPEDRVAIGSRWVFKLKLDGNGNAERFKARLVAQGFSQKCGIDYTETYSPVSRFTTIRTLLAIAASLDWHVHQLDVKTAYLYGLLQEVIYMRQPPCFQVGGGRNLVCRLIRSLYGLKQSGREWYMTLRHVLLELNFEQSVADPAVFIYKAGSKLIVLAVYVDDVLIFSKDLPAIESLKSGLAKRFKMSDQGEVGHFLGMQIERNPDGKGFTISQSTYIRSMLDRFEVSDIKGSRTPLDSKQRLVPYDGIASEEEKKRYQAEIGCLNWIGLGTRSDLVFGIGLLARFSSNPGPVHFGCVKRIMRYLAGTLDFKLRLDARSQTDIEAYSDSDYSGDKSAKSTSGWCIMVFGSTVAWGSKLQPLIADSTAAAEILALWQTSREVIAIRHFFEDIGLRQIGSGAPTTIWCDNTAAGQVVNNPVGNGITRHMERKYLKTREYIEHGLLSVKYIPTRENPADMMTKALPPIIHYEHRTSIGLGLGSTSRVGVLE